MKKQKIKKETPQADVVEKKGFDTEFIAEIQPQGGISFRDEKFIKTGDGYEACVHIYNYPKHHNVHWLANVCNLQNVVVTIDVATEDKNEVKRNINKGMKEHLARYRTAKDATDAHDAEQKVQELNLIWDELSQMSESLKLITIRIFVSGRTLDDVDKEVKKLLEHLEGNGYKGKVFLNESKNEWKSMYQNYTEQQKNEYKRYGQPVMGETLAGGNPFHFTSLNDKNGTYLGTTDVGGTVLFDMFEQNKKRMFYNGVCLGKMGAGKSTTLKKLMLDMAIRGHYIRGFDVSGEFETLVEYLGGKIVALDGSDGKLNALEVLRTEEAERPEEAGEAEVACFARHLSKLTTVYRFLVPDAGHHELMEFEQLLYQFYIDFGLIKANVDLKEQKITGLPPTSYPIWSDFLAYVENLLEKAAGSEDAVKVEREKDNMRLRSNICLAVKRLVDTYGNVFDGHTSIPDILDTQIIFFNIKNLANMPEPIFDAQMFLALSLCWDNCLKVGNKMKNLYDNKQIAWEDITRFMIFIDEAHRIINTNKIHAVEQLLLLAREARKYFGGLMYASQSIRDFVPEETNQAGVDKLKTLFELTQYKMVMQQDSNSLDLLNKVFQRQLTASDLEQIPRLEKGEMVLAISSDRNLRFAVEVSQEELDLFRGGA